MKYVVPIAIYLTALALLYSTSMQGSYLVGSDIHSEYYIASRMYYHWNIHYPHLYNASISTALLTPAISRLFNIDIVRIFKAVYPALFATVPVILYFTYKKMLGWSKGLLSVLFFMAVPVFFLELPQLPRQEIAEIFLCLIILVVVSDVKHKAWLITPMALLTVVLHYSIGFVVIFFLSAMLLVKLVALKWNWSLIQNSKVSFSALVVCLVLTVGLLAVWGSTVADGLSLKGLTNIFFVGKAHSGANVPATPTVPDGMIAAASGVDIASGVSAWGIVFRVFQWFTQLLIISGYLALLLRHKQYNVSAEFAAGTGASIVLMASCIVVYGFSGLLGITRFYHISLIFLAPMFSMGLDWRTYSEKLCPRVS